MLLRREEVLAQLNELSAPRDCPLVFNPVYASSDVHISVSRWFPIHRHNFRDRNGCLRLHLSAQWCRGFQPESSINVPSSIAPLPEQLEDRKRTRRRLRSRRRSMPSTMSATSSEPDLLSSSTAHSLDVDLSPRGSDSNLLVHAVGGTCCVQSCSMRSCRLCLTRVDSVLMWVVLYRVLMNTQTTLEYGGIDFLQWRLTAF